jgi:large subunit ribosomal protein L21
MSYAVIRVGGQQFKVSEGSEVIVGKLQDTKNISSDVLLYVDGDSVEVGTPTLKKKVDFEVVNELEKGKKLLVVRFNAKSRYRKRKGFRPQYTRLKVSKIS